MMKRWIMGGTLVAMLATAVPHAWAGEGLQRAHPQTGTAATAVGEFNASTPTHHWDIKSSVQVSRDDLRQAYLASRNAYTEKLQRYAKCSPNEAKKAIAAAHPGAKLNDVQLRNIRTNLVYFGMAEDGEYKYLVIVDAGNGKVLLDKPLPTHHERAFAGGDE
ncbi:hypothetical protein GCM10025857_30980 [Alicyclobacillus contaminans]|uniref:PepSY domain-containing protein n=1 Tax=Alicyclobacillus contaminans TaxID=392016 RepID=UPI000408BDE8|nr:PepSY domain-containing protein [Alicyclobacillus contaminans]GMA51741.1 hypothetical protein GCM10025857_30980 [Alicyclobacillus contaminans]